jgi:hypothetical protein
MRSMATAAIEPLHPADFSCTGRVALRLFDDGAGPVEVDLTESFPTLVCNGPKDGSGVGGIDIGEWVLSDFKLFYKDQPYPVEEALLRASESVVQAVREYVKARQEDAR